MPGGAGALEEFRRFSRAPSRESKPSFEVFGLEVEFASPRKLDRMLFNVSLLLMFVSPAMVFPLPAKLVDNVATRSGPGVLDNKEACKRPPQACKRGFTDSFEEETEDKLLLSVVVASFPNDSIECSSTGKLIASEVFNPKESSILVLVVAGSINLTVGP